DDGHRAIGLCNVAIGFQRRFAARFGVTPEEVELEHVGLNHLSWARAVRIGGVDRLPELLETEAEQLAKDVGTPVEIVRLTRSIPSYYLKYYYAFDKVLHEQLDGVESRAEQVIDIEGELLDMYRNPNLDEKPKLLERRGGAHGRSRHRAEGAARQPARRPLVDRPAAARRPARGESRPPAALLSGGCPVTAAR